MKKFAKSAVFTALFILISSVTSNAASVPLLVNRQNPLPESYVPSDMTAVDCTRPDGREKQRLVREAALALDEMLSDLNALFGGTPVTVTSGYRSFEYQSALFRLATDDAVSRGNTTEEAKKIAGRYTAPPGTSEHQSGLAADLHDLPCASVKFAESEKFSWLCHHAHEYGFILRYPKGKEDITGNCFEPWHWRYVGDIAPEIHESGLCLEEYIKNLKK